ncbi:TPM domain-containing protein [Microbacterium sp.]|uniref:TPM domain-containing protein n=1 Tax=Microbacterium sp. TaxID=51671 RepID=UPI0025DFF839|nr:TPM domain-containing protein [Microbacterium sp.]
MRAHWPLAVVAAAAIVLGGGAASAIAADPVALASSRVLDQSDALTAAQEASVQERLSAAASSGIDLWVVYVDQFTNPSDPEEWANQTARSNGLGPTQYLLAIATGGRQFYLSGDTAGPVSSDRLSAIEQQQILPELREENWAGAATAAADGLESAVGGGIGGTESGSSFLPALLILVLVALAALVVWLVVRSRRKATIPVRAGAVSAPDELSQLSPADLARRAASALVDTDDAVRTSEQELGFAEAQFGAEAAAEFHTAIAHAKEDLSRAFALRQQLDDDVPDSEDAARQWNAQILELCAHANHELDEKAEAFDELRKLEQNAPEALGRVQALHATVADAHDGVGPRLTALAQSYAPEALATVADNPDQAAQLLSFADEQLRAAQSAIGAGDGARAAVGIRAAEDAIAEAKRLQDAVDKLGADLAQGDQDAARLLADIDTDLASAGALPDPDGRLAPVIAATRQQVDAGRALLAGTARRPLHALEGLTRANEQIDALLDGVRDSRQKAERATQQLGMLLTQAQGQVSSAEDFITSRRGAIGARARTRLAEAETSLIQARQLQQSDPAQALTHAQRANDLAAQAIQYAQNDVGAFQGGGSGGNSGSGGSMMNAVLGGILINSLLGGGGRSSGGMFGGGGGSIFGGGGGGGGRSPGPGSFGGGGTRGRRGGGRF